MSKQMPDEAMRVFMLVVFRTTAMIVLSDARFHRPVRMREVIMTRDHFPSERGRQKCREYYKQHHAGRDLMQTLTHTRLG